MLSDEKIDAALEIFQLRLDRVRGEYLKRVGEHIAKIGKIDIDDISIIEQLRLMNVNMREIETRLAAALSKTTEDVRAMITAAAKSSYADAGRWYDQTAFTDNATMQRILAAQLEQTSFALNNLSRTKLVSDAYRGAIDDAITAVQSGVTSYQGAIESSLRKVVQEGTRVRYPSGVTRRLDTAVRQNILDGVREINQKVADAVGQEFGADGVEISAHYDSAPDHVDAQGKQYTDAEFDELQASLSRQIGGYGCRHSVMPILVGISEPSRSDQEIEALAQSSKKEVTIDGETKTRYQWTQEQRKLETAVRYHKDAINLAKAEGNDVMRRNAQAAITEINKRYYRVSKVAEIPTRFRRMKVFP